MILLQELCTCAALVNYLLWAEGVTKAKWRSPTDGFNWSLRTLRPVVHSWMWAAARARLRRDRAPYILPPRVSAFPHQARQPRIPVRNEGPTSVREAREQKTGLIRVPDFD